MLLELKLPDSDPQTADYHPKPEPLTDEGCKRALFYLAVEIGVSPKLMWTRMLAEEDKDDFRNYRVGKEELKPQIDAWMRAGLPDWAHGQTERLPQWGRFVPKWLFDEIMGKGAWVSTYGHLYS